MAGLFNEDASTDDELDADFRLGERLSINRGESSNFMEDSFESSKDFKQFCNMHRKKVPQEGQSSSSSSIEVETDLPCPSSIEVQTDLPCSSIQNSDNYHNKKRQNGDKNTEQLANPKRTCLNDRFNRSPEWQEYRTETCNHNSQSEVSLFPDSLYLHHSSSPDLFSDKKREESTNSLTDADDSDFEFPIKLNSKIDGGQASKNAKMQFPSSSKLRSWENKASGSSLIKFLDSSSENESKSIKKGALKGGRQEPAVSNTALKKKNFDHKMIKKVLDSDDSDDDNIPLAMYRSKPLIFSSSDSEDFRQGSASSTQNGATSNGLTSHSHLYGDDFGKVGSHSKQFKPFQSNQKFPKTGFNSLPTNKSGTSAGCDQPRHFHSTDFQHKNASHRSCKIRRNSRHNIPSNSIVNGFSKSSNASLPVRGRRMSGGERGARRSGSPHPNPRMNRQHKSDEAKCRGRSASASRSRTDKPSYALKHPDVFDAEESENEFFTANSYSDTETSTESLGSFTIGIKTSFPDHGHSLACTVNSGDRAGDESSDDEISVVFSSGPYNRSSEARRGMTRTLGRRYNRGTPHRQLQSTREEIISLSPDPVEQVRQVEEDERMARRLQAQFDAELDPTYVPSISTRDPSILESVDSDEIIDSGDTESDDDIAGLREVNISFPIFSPRGPGLTRFVPNRTPETAFLSSRRMIADSRTRQQQFSRDQRNAVHNFLGRLPYFPSSFLDDYETLLSLDLDDDLPPRGLPKILINRLPTRTYMHPNSAMASTTPEVTHKRSELNKECQVCLTDYASGDVLRILPCFHEFHTPCIDPWLTINHTCPVCRVTVDLEV